MNMFRSENLPCPKKNFVSIHKGTGCLIMNTQRIRVTIRFTTYFNSWIKLLCNWKKGRSCDLISGMRVGQPDLIRTNHFPGSTRHRLPQHLPEMITILHDWAQCLMPLLQEAVVSCVREDKMRKEGCYSQNEYGNTASHSFLLLINLAIRHLLQYRFKEQTGFC